MQYIDELYKNEYACRFGRESVHLGFILNTSSWESLGFDHDGKNYISVFIFEEEDIFFVEEYSRIDKYSKLPKYIVFFKGNDDISYGLRFDSRDERDDFIEHHLGKYSAFTEFIKTKSLCFN